MDWLKKLENIKKFYQEPGFVLPEPWPTEQAVIPEPYGWDFMAQKSSGPREGSTVGEFKDALTEKLVPDLGISYKSPKGWSVGAGPWAGESDPSINFQFRKEFDDGGVATPKRGLVDGPGSYSRDSNYQVERRAKKNKINEILRKEIAVANQGDKYLKASDIAYKVEDKLKIKPFYGPDGRRSSVLTTSNYPAFKDLDSMATKLDNVLKDMLISEKPLNNFLMAELTKRTGLDQGTIRKVRDNVPTFKVIANQGADEIIKLSNNMSSLKNLSLSQQLVEVEELRKGMPTYINVEEGLKKVTSPKLNIMEFARRSWNINKGQGEIEFFYKGSRSPIKWQRGTKLPFKDVSFSYGGKKYKSSMLTTDLMKKDFPEVYEMTNNANKLRQTKIDNPFEPGKKISVNSLIRKVQVDGYKWSPKFATLNVTHGLKGVKGEPFTNLSYNTSDINQLEAGFAKSLKAGNITKSQYKKVVTDLNKPFVKGDVDKAVVDRITKQAQQIKKGKFYGFDQLRSNLAFKNWIKKFPCRRSNGGSVDIDCHIEGMRHEKNLVKSGKGSKAMANKFIEGTSLASKGKFGTASRALLKGTVVGDLLFEGAYAAYNYSQGMDAADIWKHSWYSFMDPRLWKDGKYIGWVSDAEQAKLYTRKDGSIMPEIKRYVDNANLVQKHLDLQNNVSRAFLQDASIQDTGIRESEAYKKVTQAKTELDLFNEEMYKKGGMNKIYGELGRDYKTYSEREEVIEGRKQQAKKDRFEYQRDEWSAFPPDKEFHETVFRSDAARKRSYDQSYRDMEAANPLKSVFSSPEMMADYFVSDKDAQSYLKEHAPSTYGHVYSKRIMPEVKQELFKDLRKYPKYNEYIHSMASAYDPTLKGTQYSTGGIASLTRTTPPESGPAPQGEGLSYILNRVREW